MKEKKLKVICWKAFILTLMLTLYSIPNFSQNDSAFERRVDSLKTVLVLSKGLAKRDVLQELAYEYLRVNDSIALPFSVEAFKMSWQFGDSLRIVKSGRTKAMIFNEFAQYDSTIAISHTILPIARRNGFLIEIKYFLNLLVSAHIFKAQYDKALAYSFESLELRKKYEDSPSISIALANTGLVYFKMDNYEKALEYFQGSLELKRWNGKNVLDVDRASYQLTLTNIALCYIYLMNLTKGDEFVMKAYESCKQGCPDTNLMQLHFAAGLLCFKREDMDEATRKFSESLVLAKKISYQRYELDNLTYLSEISIRTNKLKQAETYLLQAEPLIKNGVPFNAEVAMIYEKLSQVYSGLGNYRKVAFYLSKHIRLKDTIFNAQLTGNLMRIEAEYLERENIAKIEAQAKILALRDQVILRQRFLNVITGVVAVLSIAFVILLIQNVKRKKRTNELLEQKVKERTMELELNNNLLIKSFHERDIQFQRMSTEIKSSLATIKGLGLLVSHDVNTTLGSSYLAKIEEASNSLIQGLNRTHSNDFV